MKRIRRGCIISNAYFQVLPRDVQQALGKSAFNAFVNHPPAFEFKGKWETLPEHMRMRWLAIVETVMNQLQGLEEHVTTKMDLFNQAHQVLDDSVKRFEAIRPDDAGFNNYQLLEWLRSAHAEIINARLLMLRADIVAGNVQHEGDESTARVSIPNVKDSE